MGDIGVVLIIVLFGALAVAAFVWQFPRAEAILRRWAAASGYEIVHFEHRWFRVGPFWWRTSKGMAVFHVVVRDSAGRERSGFVRVGGWFWGLWSDVAKVEWDDEG
jgi:hypothetical protein